MRELTEVPENFYTKDMFMAAMFWWITRHCVKSIHVNINESSQSHNEAAAIIFLEIK